MEYRITVEELEYTPGESYPKETDVYQQTIAEDYLNLQEIIKAVNVKFNKG